MGTGKMQADVVELVDTLSWGGSGESRAGSTPAIGTNQVNLRLSYVLTGVLNRSRRINREQLSPTVYVGNK